MNWKTEVNNRWDSRLFNIKNIKNKKEIKNYDEYNGNKGSNSKRVSSSV